jgi:hypothetical protein
MQALKSDPQPGDGPVYITSNIRFKAVGDQLEIEFVCPDAADCAPPPHLLAQESP